MKTVIVNVAPDHNKGSSTLKMLGLGDYALDLRTFSAEACLRAAESALAEQPLVSAKLSDLRLEGDTLLTSALPQRVA